ncbi:hypothetical protein [Sphingomonas ginsenosidimutans]|uniref:hypothetical protein n=1 Tax=Sphingomonas ginsenosidimutans TaxID=862134 RepID=UPI001596DA27|nr:hypothetical protein [Sphingomonas ginsenosidimutans]
MTGGMITACGLWIVIRRSESRTFFRAEPSAVTVPHIAIIDSATNGKFFVIM